MDGQHSRCANMQNLVHIIPRMSRGQSKAVCTRAYAEDMLLPSGALAVSRAAQPIR